MKRALYLAALPFLLAACSRGLSPDDAKAAVQQNSLIRQTDNISVDGVSPSSDTEAVVRTTIKGRTLNLKFRRFDNGWTWEFVETKAGGWISPDVALGQIREEDRGAAALKWADEHKDAYAKTAAVVNILSIYVPNPNQGVQADLWLEERRKFATVFKDRGDPGAQERFAVLSSDHPQDAWGAEVQGRFDATKNHALIFSSGPDKVAGTEDDLACLNTFRRGFEDGRQIWERDLTWYLPEGLGTVVQPFADDPADKIEFTKVLKP